MDLDQVIDSALGCLQGPESRTQSLPAQFFPGAAALPERRLMMAVLARSLLDLQTHAGTGSQRARRRIWPRSKRGSRRTVTSGPSPSEHLPRARLDAAAVRSRQSVAALAAGRSRRVVRLPIPAADRGAVSPRGLAEDACPTSASTTRSSSTSPSASWRSASSSMYLLTGRAAFAGPAAASLLLLATWPLVAAQSGEDAHVAVEAVPGTAGAVRAHQQWGAD